MFLKFTAMALTLLMSVQAFADNELCQVAFRCSPVENPVNCSIGETGILVKSRNECQARSLAYHVMCKLDLSLEEAPFNCKSTAQARLPSICPQLFPVAPNFCEDGRLVVEVDANGCNLAPRCVRD